MGQKPNNLKREYIEKESDSEKREKTWKRENEKEREKSEIIKCRERKSLFWNAFVINMKQNWTVLLKHQ